MENDFNLWETEFASEEEVCDCEACGSTTEEIVAVWVPWPFIIFTMN